MVDRRVMSEPSGVYMVSRTFCVSGLNHASSSGVGRARARNLSIKSRPPCDYAACTSKKNRKTDPMLVVSVNAGLRMDEDFLLQT